MVSLKDLEDAIEHLENLVADAIPQISQTFRRLSDDLSRYGPPQMPELPNISIPGVVNGPFASIPPPPPPPPPVPFYPPTSSGSGSAILDWASKHKVAAVVLGLSGCGLVGYAGWSFHSARSVRRLKSRRAAAGSEDKRQVVVLLGADTPHGTALAVDLESQGYIVVASVSTPEGVIDLEKKGKGYIKALVLDPSDPASTSPFLRSLQSTLSLRFPLTPGDPYTTTPSLLPNVVSIISLLALPGTSSIDTNTPEESYEITDPSSGVISLPLAQSYLPHIISAHVVPLNVIQRTLPLLRSSQKKGVSNLSVIVALRGGARSIGATQRDAATAMSDSAMSKACEILRRDVKSSPDLSKTRVVVIDVGEISFGIATEGRTIRKPTDGTVFTREVIRVVRGRQWTHLRGNYHGQAEGSMVKQASRTVLSVGCASMLIVRDLWRGDRFSIGAGAGTYACTRRLPTALVDTFLLLPRRLAALTDWVREEAVVADRVARRRAAERRRSNKEDEVITTSPENAARSLTVSSKANSITGSRAGSVSAASDVESGKSEAENSVDSGSEGDPEHRQLDASWVSLKEAESASASMIQQ